MKPECKLIGEDGNVFAVVGKAREALRKAGLNDEAEEMFKKAMSCSSYSEVLVLLGDYVEIV